MTFIDMSSPGAREDASAIAGWTSIACWIIVYSPQIWENYQLRSGEGLSVSFIVLWLAGDLTNLAGGAMAHLLPTMIILAVYYSLCDIILLYQVYYYRHLAKKRLGESGGGSKHVDERSRLLSAAVTDDETSSSRNNVDPEDQDQQQLQSSVVLVNSTDVVVEHGHPKPLVPPALLYPLMLSFVAAVGVGAWLFQRHTRSSGAGGHQPELPKGRIPEGHEVELEFWSQLLGYASAALYIGSRVPQIAHNYKTKCAGLSLEMFFFSISGNVTYCLSILLKSTEPRYVLANASWLAGAGLTVFLDLIVLAQFAYFRRQERLQEKLNGVERT